MAATNERPRRFAWWSDLTDGAARALGFAHPGGGDPAPAPRSDRRSRPAASARTVAEARKLAGEGLGRIEIARRTGLSQDTVGMLLNLVPAEPVESSGRGTFFRILESRMAG